MMPGYLPKDRPSTEQEEIQADVERGVPERTRRTGRRTAWITIVIFVLVLALLILVLSQPDATVTTTTNVTLIPDAPNG